MDDDGSPAPGPPGRLARYLGRIIVSALAHPPGELVETGVSCRRRPGHRRSPGYIRAVWTPDTGEVEWICPECGDYGVVYNWQGTCWDISTGKTYPVIILSPPLAEMAKEEWKDSLDQLMIAIGKPEQARHK